MLVAMFSTNIEINESSVALLPIKLLASYQIRQTAASSTKSKGRWTSRSTICSPTFSVAKIFLYEVRREISIFLSNIWVLTITTASGKQGSLQLISFDLMVWFSYEESLSLPDFDDRQLFFSSDGTKFRISIMLFKLFSTLGMDFELVSCRR